MLNTSVLRKAVALLGLMSVFAAANSFAQETQWQKDHPRRVEVNKRLQNQEARIDNKVADGDMSKAKAKKLKKADKQIHQEEKDMAAQNGGHITKQEQKTLNQQENAVSKKIAQ